MTKDLERGKARAMDAERLVDLVEQDCVSVLDTGERGVVLYCDDAIAIVQLGNGGHQGTYLIEQLRVLGH